MFRTILVLLVACLASCGSTSSIQRAPIPELGSAVREDMARVFLLRSNDLVGSERAVLVYDGEREIGRLGKGHFLAWEHAAGRRLLRLVFDRPMLEGGGLETLVDHKSEGGQTVYYEVTLRYAPKDDVWGKVPGSPVATRVDEVEGARLVAQSTPAKYEASR